MRAIQARRVSIARLDDRAAGTALHDARIAIDRQVIGGVVTVVATEAVLAQDGLHVLIVRHLGRIIGKCHLPNARRQAE